MKTINKITYISAILLIIMIIGYIAFSFTQITTNIENDYFINTYFKAKNNSDFIKFNELDNSVICYDGRLYNIEELIYSDGIFKMYDEETNEEFLVVVIDNERLYMQNKNLYLYRVVNV